MAEDKKEDGNGSITAIASFLGPLSNAISSYYDARNRKFLARAQASSLEFEGSIALVNAKAAERDAEVIFANAAYEKARTGMQSAMDTAAMDAEAAAGGVTVGVGSAAEAIASRKVSAAMDIRAIGINATREVNVARTRGTNYRNESLIKKTSADNVRRMGGAINPGVAAHIGLGNGVMGSQSSTAGSSSLGNYYGGSR